MDAPPLPFSSLSVCWPYPRLYRPGTASFKCSSWIPFQILDYMLYPTHHLSNGLSASVTKWAQCSKTLVYTDFTNLWHFLQWCDRGALNPSQTLQYCRYFSSAFRCELKKCMFSTLSLKLTLILLKLNWNKIKTDIYNMINLSVKPQKITKQQ